MVDAAISVMSRALSGMPRVSLADLPTPLEPTPRLARAAGLRSLYIKRDDLTGFALGGNKARQLEYLFGDALQHRATAVITGAGVESNHCRMVSAACAKLGMRACLILRGDEPRRVEGNLLLDKLFGAEVRYLAADRFYGEFATTADAWAAELRAAGEVPYLMDTLGSDSASLGIAALGYVQAMVELEGQFAQHGWRPDAIYVCSGAATQAGLLVAKRALDLPYSIVAFSASPFIPNKGDVIAKIATRAARLLGIGLEIAPSDVVNLEEQIGPGYGSSTPASRAALRLAARQEGLLLDPTYTAKALAGLLEHARRGRLDPDASVLFIHTGGTPSLFLARNAEELSASG